MTEVKTSPDESTLPPNPQPPAPILSSTERLSALRSEYDPEAIFLAFDDVVEPLIVYISQQVVLGRRSQDESGQRRIDLTPYGAHSKGISRVHAMLRRAEKGLSIEDLGSRNGTRLNGEKLTPYQATPLKSGDRLELGQLAFEILFD
ncbi:MAG TPA: FHA domain-containing protein [Aggregatilineales bacterium]|nr:FHA domain-containing protein [Aggregatilineales bacterium]